jgi:hypothetical protein
LREFAKACYPDEFPIKTTGEADGVSAMAEGGLTVVGMTSCWKKIFREDLDRYNNKGYIMEKYNSLL